MVKSIQLLNFLKASNLIKGFEYITRKISEKEYKALEFLTSHLRATLKPGEENAVTNNKMQKVLKRAGFKVSSARVRQLIHFIRAFGIIEPLISTSKGYFLARSIEQLEKYIESLEQRIRSIQEIVDKLGAYLREWKRRLEASEKIEYADKKAEFLNQQIEMF